MTDDRPDLAAAELALGLLEGAERAAATARVLADPDFAAQVESWRAYFAALYDAWPEATPSVWLADRVADSIAALPSAQPVVRPGAFPWRFAAGGLAAIAATLFGIMIVRPGPVRPVAVPIPVAVAPQPAGPLVVASLAAGDRPIPAVFDPAIGTLRIAPAPDVTAAQVAELWIIGADGVPHALGLLTPGPTAIRLDRARGERLTPGAVLAISVEPSGGSPTGLPTGPVVAKGALAAI